jgi:hypothetical protein
LLPSISTGSCIAFAILDSDSSSIDTLNILY